MDKIYTDKRNMQKHWCGLMRHMHKYLKKFGENSLDPVLLSEPLIHQPTKLDVNETNRDTRMLEDAIKNNKPLEQIPKEIWEKMIF
ncbi:MAG: hypothetical protein ACLT4I_11150 [Megamonas funiformis]|uniref:hypothetical protein n=1 Tax=Megamonas funiformis TaxID=437897 RepID=UPI003995F13A